MPHHVLNAADPRLNDALMGALDTMAPGFLLLNRAGEVRFPNASARRLFRAETLEGMRPESLFASIGAELGAVRPCAV